MAETRRSLTESEAVLERLRDLKPGLKLQTEHARVTILESRELLRRGFGVERLRRPNCQ